MSSRTPTRRRFIKTAVTATAAAVVSAHPSRAARKPNVLVLLVDDLRADGLASLGNGIVRTPNLDSIIARGCVFRRAYTMGSMVGAVCLPSRTMVLTGQSLFRAENAPSGGPDSLTFPRAMKEAGYATVHAGKFGNSPKHITDEFDESSDPGDAGAVADSIIEFIRRHAGDAPLFVYMAGKEPHDPQRAPDEYYAMYRPDDIPLPDTFLPYHPFDNGEMTVRDEMTLPFPRTPQDVRGKLARYYASISYLDAQFGRVLQALRDAGQYDNTYFVIAGDNGLSLGEHGLLGKQNLYEFGGMHVPLIFAGPGIAQRETQALAYLMDVFPTVCDFAGVAVPARVEGRSLTPVIRGELQGVRDWLYTGYKDVQRSITDGRSKLIRYPKVDKTQLFDLQADPHELNDLGNQPEHEARVRAMLEKLAELQREFSDPAPLTVTDVQSAEWSPEKLTPKDIQFQIEETARCRGDQ